MPERTQHIADCGVPITCHIRFPAWSLLEHICLQANRGAGEHSERYSCATVDIYASVFLCNACLHATHYHTNVCQSRSRICVSQDLEQGTRLSYVADRHNRGLRRCGWIFFSDSIRMFPSTCLKLPREELMYPLPDLHFTLIDIFLLHVPHNGF